MNLSLSLLSTLFILLSPAFGDPSHGCSPTIPKPIEWKPTPGEIKLFKVNDRMVRVTVPPKYNETVPAPMILAFHDREQPVEHLEFDGGWDNPQINPDIIMVYPHASDDNENRWLSDITPRKKLVEGQKRRRENDTADLLFTHSLVRDMENLMCIDTSRIYAMGVGTGGGMMHLLACNNYLSRLFAAYVAVAGMFGRGKEGKRPWGLCEPALNVVPMMEVHGTDDRVAPYWLGEGENGKKRMIPGHWVEDWAERNGCGTFVDEEAWLNDEDQGQKTWVAKYDGGGVVSETVAHAGSAIRVARKCPGIRRKIKTAEENPDATDAPVEKTEEEKAADEQRKEEERKKEEEEAAKEPEVFPLPTKPIEDEQVSVLHYQLKGYGHGWPRQHLKRQTEVVFHGEQVRLSADKKFSNDTFFDTTKAVLSFLRSHKLDERWSKRSSITPGAEGGPLSEEAMAEEVRKKYGLEHAGLGKGQEKPKSSESGPSEELLQQKLKEFKAAQERIEKANGGETPKDHDEL